MNLKGIKMDNKRFSSIFYEEEGRTITDNGEELTRNEVVNLLNNQQDKIDKLQKENIELKKLKKYFAEWIGVKEDNLSLRCGDMTEKQLNNTKEKINCKNKYLYEHSMFWECNDGCKCQILEDDVADLLNEQDRKIKELANKYSNRETKITKAVDDILQNSFEIMNQRLSEESKCNYKKAIIEFCKFMNINSPLIEMMVDEFLQEVF